MTGLGWALSAGGLVSLVCLVVAVYYRGELQRARLALREADEDEHDWEAARAEYESRIAASEAIRHESLGRAEEVIRGLRAEIESLLADVQACRDPGVVADRLRRLLSPSRAGTAVTGHPVVQPSPGSGGAGGRGGATG